jgi:hypothetical protein
MTHTSHPAICAWMTRLGTSIADVLAHAMIYKTPLAVWVNSLISILVTVLIWPLGGYQ